MSVNKVSHVVQSHGRVLSRYHSFVYLCIYCMPSRTPRDPHSVNKYTYLPSSLPPLPAPTPLRPSTTRPRVYDVTDCFFYIVCMNSFISCLFGLQAVVCTWILLTI